MNTDQHLVIVSIVPQAQWQTGRNDVLSTVHTTLRDRALRRGLRLHGEPHEDIEVLPGDTRVRITVSADGTLLNSNDKNTSENGVSAATSTDTAAGATTAT